MGASLGLCPTFHPQGDHSSHVPCKGCSLRGKARSDPDFCALLPLRFVLFCLSLTQKVALYTNYFELAFLLYVSWGIFLL